MDDQNLRLGVIDESEEEVREFFRFFEDAFEPIKIEIGETVSDMIDNIVKNSVDGVAIDYRLKEKNQDITFNGNELFNELRSSLRGFPCFLMTSYPEEARQHNVDAFRIFSKKVMQPDPDHHDYDKGKELIDRIKLEIQHYQEDISNKEERVSKLLDISRDRNLTAKEEEELIDLDDFFERLLDNKHRVPSHLKKPSNEKKLTDLLKKADEIIKKLDNDS